MKQIKKLFLTSTLLLVSYVGFSQTTPTMQVRVQDTVTAFGQNLSVGTQIFCVSDSTLWQATGGILKTLSINTAKHLLVLVNKTVRYTVDKFEAASTPLGTYALTYIPKNATTGVTVAMNGAALRPGDDYTTAGSVLTITSAQSQYDKFIVSYTYYR